MSVANRNCGWIAAAIFLAILAIVLMIPWWKYFRKHLDNKNSGLSDVKALTSIIFFMAYVVLFLAPFLTLIIFTLTGFDIPIGKLFDLLPSSQIIGRCEQNKAVVCYSGTIVDSDVERLRAEIEQGRPETIYLELHSGGGSVSAAEKMIDIAIKHNLHVAVKHTHARTDCASACVTIVAAIPRERQNINPEANFMVHVTRRGLTANYGPLIPMIINLIETQIDADFFDHVESNLRGSDPLSKAEKEGQTEVTDALEGPGVKNGRLTRLIKSCPAPNPFQTIKGITLKWSEIMAILAGDNSIRCPRPD